MTSTAEGWRVTHEQCRACAGPLVELSVPALASVALPVALARCKYCRAVERRAVDADGEHWHEITAPCWSEVGATCQRLGSRTALHCKGTLSSCSRERPRWP